MQFEAILTYSYIGYQPNTTPARACNKCILLYYLQRTV